MFWSICSIVVSILLFYWLIDFAWWCRFSQMPRKADFHKEKDDVENGTSEQTSLFVGIMSKPDNFLQRKSLRDTWLSKVVDSNNIQYKFFIGKHLCDVHLLDRTSEYSCEEVKFSVSEDKLDNTTLYANSKLPYAAETDVEPCSGFSFVVHHPIIVTSLGVNLDVATMANGSSHSKVVLTDLRTNVVITSVTFNTRSLSNSWDNEGYDFKKLASPVLLPKGFEGSVKVKTIKTKTTGGSCKHSSGWSHGGLIGVLRVFPGKLKAAKNLCVLATFGFTIKDLNMLRLHIDGKQKRSEAWRVESENLWEDVRNEAHLYGDILFLDMIDVYRNLPLKLKLFINWLYKNHNATYLLKTDDDTLLDVGRISAQVEGGKRTGSDSDWDWWSCMRLGWPVHRSGKFRESYDQFERESYPMFPSGAGYVLAPHTVAWLNHRLDKLTVAYQGEDTALGIWLEEMGPRPLAEANAACHWSCGERDQTAGPACNAMQLSVSRVYDQWGRYLLCGQRICHG